MSVATMSSGREGWGITRCAQQRRIPARPAARMRRPVSPWRAPIVGALLLTSFIMLVGILPTARDYVPRPTAAAIRVKVAHADTLWSIAEAHRLPGTSTAQMVETIMEANDLKSASLQPGATLSIPVLESGGTAFAQVSGTTAAE